MANTPPGPIIPPVDPVDGDENGMLPDDPVREVEGETTIDPDIDADQVDSATADRIASGGDEPDDPRGFPQGPAITHP